MQCSGRTEESVSRGSYLEKRGWEMAGKNGEGSCSGWAQKWRRGTFYEAGSGRDSRSDDGISLSDGTGVKGVRPMRA